MPSRKNHRDSDRQAAERAWLGGSLGATTLDAVLEEPLFSPTAQIGAQQSAWLLREMAATCGTGMPLTAALDMLGATRSATPVGQVYATMTEVVSRGAALSEAMAAHPALFTAATVARVRAGERTGTLAAALLAAAETIEEDAEVAALTRRAILYPPLAAAGLGLVLAALSLTTGPILASIGGAGLPSTTKTLLTLTRYLPLAAIPILLAVTALRLGLRMPAAAPGIRQSLARWQARLPVLGDLTRQRGQAHAAAVLADLLAGGLPVPEALRAAAAASPDVHTSEALTRAARQTDDGASLAEACAAQPQLGALATVARTGEATGSLPTLLRSHATLARAESCQRAQAVVAVVEPIACAAIGLTVLGWLIGLFLPVLTASAGLR